MVQKLHLQKIKIIVFVLYIQKIMNMKLIKFVNQKKHFAKYLVNVDQVFMDLLILILQLNIKNKRIYL